MPRRKDGGGGVERKGGIANKLSEKVRGVFSWKGEGCGARIEDGRGSSHRRRRGAGVERCLTGGPGRRRSFSWKELGLNVFVLLVERCRV